MPLVFLSPIKRTYKSDICSLSTLLGIVLLVAAILLPLFAAYATEDFWVRITEYTEQPLVDYYNNYMIYITSINKQYHTYFDSSITELKEKFVSICQDNNGDICEQLPNGFLIATSTDIDGDGIKDKITIKYEFNKFPEDNDLDIKLMFFLKYGLTKKVKLIMTPMIYINIPVFKTGNGKGKEIILNGNLELIQKSPIISTTTTSQIYNIEKPFEIPYNDNSPFDLLYYYNKYKSNNYTIKYNYEKIEKSNNNGKIQIVMDMYIPKLQQILYIQSIFESIKYAWMQYFYIFLTVYIVLYILFKFIIQNNIFYSQIKSDI